MVYLKKSHMHEENIEYIEQYLQENSQFPLEQLIATLEEAGYHTEDIQAAQARLVSGANEEPESVGSPTESLGSESFTPSPVVPSVEQPALEPVKVETLQHTMSPEKKPKFRVILLWIAGGCVVLGLAATAYFLSLPEPAVEPVAALPAPATAEAIPEPIVETKPSLGDILAPHAALMSQGDYRVSIKADRMKDGVLSMEEYAAYMRRGEIVRAEFLATPTVASILKNGKVFEINIEKKEFREYDPSLAPGMAIVDRMKADFQVIESVMQRSKSGEITWVERSGSVYADSETDAEQTLRVRLDPASRMLVEISTRSSASEAWKIISVAAMPITGIDELMRFPMDYKKMTL